MKKHLPLTKHFTLFAVGASMLISPLSYGQESSKDIVIDKATTVLIKKADSRYGASDYNTALPLYLNLLKKDADNFLYNYRAGECYLNSNVDVAKSIVYLEKANDLSKVTDKDAAAFYLTLGKAHHLFNHFGKALEYYNLSLKAAGSSNKALDKAIAQCELGQSLIAKKSSAMVSPLGTEVNSVYPEYNPAVMYNKANFLFESARPGARMKRDRSGYYSNIYQAKTTKAEHNQNQLVFENAAILRGKGNTSKDDAPVDALGGTSTVLIAGKKGLYQMDVFKGGRSTDPTKHSISPFSGSTDLSSVSYTRDGKTVFFADSKKGGYGGKDIYKATLQEDGTWTAAVNLGPEVNTTSDETTPFFDATSKILYFSSTGHNTIGGFDVFKSKLNEGAWSLPRNSGYPINSGADELGYTYDRTSNTGYFSTMREDGVGNYDIYMLRYSRPLNVKVHANFMGDLEPKDLNIKATNTKKNTSKEFTLIPGVDQSVSYKNNSEYKLLVPQYLNDEAFDSLVFSTPSSLGDSSYYQEINYSILRNHKDSLIGYQTTVYNALFNIEEYIDKKGLRNKRQMFAKFPTCFTNDDKYAYYSKEELTKQQEYAEFVKTLDGDLENFTIHTFNNYIDTAHFYTDSVYAANALSRGISADVPPIDTTLKPILFDFTSAIVKEDVQHVVSFLKSNPEAVVEIVGHTDKKGNFPSNLKLSIERANKVKALINSMGIDNSRLTALGKGKREPVAPNDTEANRTLNRRVEFHVTTP